MQHSAKNLQYPFMYQHYHYPKQYVPMADMSNGPVITPTYQKPVFARSVYAA